MKLNLNERDGICFFGDSITAHGWWIEEIFEFFKNNYPEKKTRIYNCGIPGSKGYEANIKNRMYADLFNFFPKYVVVMFGMNDIDMWAYDEKLRDPDKVERREARLREYPKSLEYIIEMCEKNGAEPIICSPTVYDEYNDLNVFNYRVDGVLKKCAEYAEQTAKKHGLVYIDMRGAIEDNIGKKPIGEDRVHPNEFGHHLMAQSFLKGIGAIDKIDTESKCEYSEANKLRFEAEQRYRNIEFVERDVMLWQYEEDMPLNERKERVEQRAENEPSFADTAKKYLANVDYRNVIFGELVRLTAEMYE